MYVTRILSERTNISKHTNTRVNERNTQQPPPGITHVAHIRTGTRFNKQTKQNEKHEQKIIVIRHNERSEHTNMVHVQQTLLRVRQTKRHTEHNSRYEHKMHTKQEKVVFTQQK